jgi:putative NADH-flavin reductase
MKSTVVGAIGRAGSHVLTEGVRRGHQITAFTPRPDRITDLSTLANVVNGVGRDPESVSVAVAGPRCRAGVRPRSSR